MKFCSQCAHPIEQLIPAGDHRTRAVCSQCQQIFYENPNNIVCSIPIYQQQVLLCRRGIEPRKGLWTLPGGFLENGESLQQGALRESQEEAHLNLKMGRLFSVVDLPQYNQVHFFYLATMLDDSWQLTPESTEIQLFDFDQIPWPEIAFKTVSKTLQHLVAHSKNYQQLSTLEASITP